MATFVASLSVDIRAINFNYPIANISSSAFADNVYSNIGGTIYEDLISVDYDGGLGEIALGGTGFVLDPFGNIVAGVVTFVGEYYPNVSLWSVSGTAISAAAYYRASLTPNTLDDYMVIMDAFAGNDLFVLSDYSDFMDGIEGNDRMLGYGGNDTLYGNVGNDTLNGGRGKDQLIGQSGRDVFVFERTADSGAAATSSDVIWGFVHRQDRIDLHLIDAFARTSGNDKFIWKGTGAFTSASKGEVRFQKFKDYTMVFIDTDGDARAEMAIRLKGLQNLTASDFLL